MPDEILRKPSGANVRLGTFVLLVILVAIAFGGAGYLYGINAGKTLTSTTKTATATSTASATTSKTVSASATATNSTADWKTYTNEKYGFSFKYPITWSVNDDNKGNIYVSDSAKTYQLEGGDMAPIVIQYAKDTFSGSIDNYVAQGSGALKSLLQKATATIGGKTAYVIQGVTQPVDHDSRVIFDNGNVITCSSNGGNLSGQDSGGTITKTFNQILSTFQFTP